MVLIFLAGLATILITCYFYVNYNIYNYWNRRGVKTISPSFLWGNMKPVVMMKKPHGELIKEIYNSTKERFVGLFIFLSPNLLVCDPKLCHRIFAEDFQHFQDRGIFSDEKIDPLSVHLLTMRGENWKNMRKNLTPTFTSGKLKMMFQTLVDCGDSLQSYLSGVVDNGDTVDVRDLSARYTTNIIASCAFGIDVDCIKEPDHIFRRMGSKLVELSFKNGIKQVFSIISPKLIKLFRIKITDSSVEDFMISIVKQTIDYREKNDIQRKDFMQLLIQLRNTGKVGNDADLNIKCVNGTKSLTLTEVTAQVLFFFIAGFETSSTTMSFCLYELARNPEIQRKLQKEIDTILKKYDGKITYEAIMEMKYLDNCMSETLRKYPPVPALQRICTKDYKIPGTDFVIEKDTLVTFPCMAIQHDPKYYPDPQIFNPDRFNAISLDDAGKSCIYFPFGVGPRTCIGLRFAKIQFKVGIIIMLLKFNFSLKSELEEKEVKMSPRSFLLCPAAGIELKVTRKLN